MTLSKISILCTASGVGIEQAANAADSWESLFIMVAGSVTSYVAVEFVKGFIEGWRTGRAKRKEGTNG